MGQFQPMSHNPTPFVFRPSTQNFWEVELSEILRKNNCVVYQDDWTRDYKVTGDGIRLRLPFSTIINLPSDELVDLLIRGIKVSLLNRERLNY